MSDTHLLICSVPEAKIRDYLLNADHPEGRAKAKYFSALGFSIDRVDAFQTALAEHPVRNPVERAIDNLWGTKFVVRCRLETPVSKKPCIVTVWIREGSSTPRLVTAYPAE